ncbi:YbaB/EbfC family nucleoid-associated protein [Streptomyces sp. V4I23]|uniref:YbaB/EbfC family nucleoid-associated protein n=1 Tax=Streptomyces sp. V4I23 TaxID=3042282 RepID=UPI0027D91A29|nr:YbaB/EbfC family nucleoid-associated protein [Streptomyces sp. V4I23]
MWGLSTGNPAAELRQASATARSVDRSVQVTVGSKGDLVSVDFLDGKYKTMAASQLSAAVIQAASQARADMARHMVEKMDPVARTIAGGAAQEGRELDWEKLLGPLKQEMAADDHAPTPMSRLRDEIDDEEEGNGRG